MFITLTEVEGEFDYEACVFNWEVGAVVEVQPQYIASMKRWEGCTQVMMFSGKLWQVQETVAEIKAAIGDGE